jgi:hypothetical protein
MTLINESDEACPPRGTSESPADINPWFNAREMVSLGGLTAAWLRGEVATHPCYGDPDDSQLEEETLPLVPHLARLNVAGLVTLDSQPGAIDAISRQRAMVAGLVEPDSDALEQLRTLVAPSELVLSLHEPGPRIDGSIPLTMGLDGDGGLETYTLGGGGQYSSGDLAEMFTSFSPTAHQTVATAVRYQIIDPVWGRTDLLWQVTDHLTLCLARHDAEAAGETVCRGCGCTDSYACPGGCTWVPDPEMLGDLCSACAPAISTDPTARGEGGTA